jgi:hypothetical protein
MPERFPSFLLRGIRPDQSGDDRGADLAAMDVRTVEEVEVAIGIDMGTGLKADDGAEAFGVFERQMQRDPPSDRAADQDRRSSSSAVITSRIMAPYWAEVSRYSSLCQPDGGDDLPCQGMSKAMTRWASVIRSSFISARYWRPSAPAVCRHNSGTPRPASST